MSQYGEVIDNSAIDNSESQMTTFDTWLDEYFNHPILTKVRDDQQQRNSVYACKLYCLLNRKCRYIFVTTNTDNMPIGYKIPARNLNWVSYQTRTLDDCYNVDTHTYSPTRETPLYIKIHRIHEDNKCSKYECVKIPHILITILSDGKTIYQPTGTVVGALETFETIITRK